MWTDICENKSPEKSQDNHMDTQNNRAKCLKFCNSHVGNVKIRRTQFLLAHLCFFSPHVLKNNWINSALKCYSFPSHNELIVFLSIVRAIGLRASFTVTSGSQTVTRSINNSCCFVSMIFASYVKHDASHVESNMLQSRTCMQIENETKISRFFFIFQFNFRS